MDLGNEVANAREARKEIDETVIFLCKELRNKEQMRTPQMVAAIAELARNI